MTGIRRRFPSFLFGFPLVDVHVAETFGGAVAPGEAEVAEVRVEDRAAAAGANALHVVLPEFDQRPARTGMFRDIPDLPVGRIHAGTLAHATPRGNML